MGGNGRGGGGDGNVRAVARFCRRHAPAIEELIGFARALRTQSSSTRSAKCPKMSSEPRAVDPHGAALPEDSATARSQLLLLLPLLAAG